MKTWLLMGSVASVLLAAAPAWAENWHTLARSVNNAFMADVDAIVVEGDITSIKLATVPLKGDAGDYSHSVETFQFRCAQGDWRTAGVVEYGPDGAESGRYPEDGASWEEMRPNTQPAFIKGIACDGARANPPHWPTVQAFVDAGRT